MYLQFYCCHTCFYYYAAIAIAYCRYEDRYLMQCLSFVTCIGCLFAMTYPNHLFGLDIPYTEVQYVIGVAFIFVALQVRQL
jgi:hypothetical protein